MSSLIRRIEKRIAKQMGKPITNNTVTYAEGPTHVGMLHPTKGWRKVSHKRLAVYASNAPAALPASFSGGVGTVTTEEEGK
jgi:hypothetical protein